jgi:hypothetical protein
LSDCIVGDSLQIDDFSTAEPLVGGDQHLALGVQNAVTQGLGAKASEHDAEMDVTGTVKTH